MPGLCRAPGCDSPTTSRYSIYCSRHQSRLRRQGDVAQKAISKAELKTYLSGSGSASRKTPTVPLGVSLRPTGRLMLNVIGSVAQFEREVMLERQREGIRKAKSEGRYKGRGTGCASQERGDREAGRRGLDQGEDCRRAWGGAWRVCTASSGSGAVLHMPPNRNRAPTFRLNRMPSRSHKETSQAAAERFAQGTAGGRLRPTSESGNGHPITRDHRRTHSGGN